jgi:two-component system chemotaxis sensor kinase CheA
MDDLTREELEQLIGVFRDQSLQILEEMSHDLLALESKGADSEVLTRIKRAAHTIKGDSACIGLTGVTELAHKVEDLIEEVEGGRCRVERSLIDLIFEWLDTARAAITSEEMLDVEAGELSRLFARMDDLLAGQSGEGEAAGDLIRASGDGETAEGKAAEGAQGILGRHKRDYVRVEAGRIDALLNLAGEMVIARSMMNQVGPELELAVAEAGSDLLDRFGQASMQMGKLIAQLQKSVLKMRMVTIDHLFRRFARPMRELANEHGKLIDFDISGGGTELDRSLIDLLYEPLLHLLRNAVDHGLEREQYRERAGKPARGRLSMRAYHEGNQVVVEVSDDGRGIDIASLKERAILSGLISSSEAERMTDDEAVELIFAEGISTASEVTRISGRGIGAFTVKSVVEQLRGSVAVKTRRGEGTSFVLRMPLTLAIIKALLFRACGQTFALPLLAVSEIARAGSTEVTRIEAFESYRLRDRFISLIRPGAVLGIDRRKGGRGARLRKGKADGDMFIIILGVGNRKFGIVADSIIGEQELVIKPLESEWVQNEALAGAAVLGDGSVVLIMDAGMIFRKAIKFERGNGTGKEAYAI